MNREEIICMAREAGMNVVDDQYSLLPFLERFFQAAYAAGVAAEREACAKVVESHGTWFTTETVAAAIRARGQA